MINTARTFIAVMLISVFYLATATAEITIDEDSNTIHVETNNYKVRFAPNAITYLHNKLTDETYTLPLEPTYEIQAAILGRNEDFYASRGTVKSRKINDHTAETRFQKGENEITLTIAIEPNTEDLLITLDGVADFSGVSAIQWAIDNLDLANLKLITPSEKVPLLDATSVIKRRPFLYPTTSWEAQLAIVESEGGGFYIRSTDTTFTFKELFYWRFPDKFGLNISTQNQAPWDTLTTAESVTWRLNTYAGDWCVPAQMYRNWMEETFDPRRLSEVPPWVNDIGLVAIHSALNAELLPNLAEVVDPTKTLLYLTDWNKHRPPILPDYTAHEKLDDFLKVARRHGFRVMLHVNLFGCSVYHPLYPEFKRYQYRRPETGELSGWMWDELDSPERSAHISLASSRWRNLLVQQWKAIWEKYDIEAFHLDVSHYVLNDANGLIEGLTSAEANVLMHKELVAAMPNVVFSGEGLHEVTFFRESFAQRSGVIIGAHHPINAFLFSSYTHSYGGLGTPGAQDPRYHLYLETVESQGYLPTLWINKTEMLEIPLLQQVLSVAQQGQELGLQPDVGCDWGPNTIFQYTTQTGETVTYQRTDSGSVLILPSTDGYERVYGVTQAQTYRSLRHWSAYNETTLLGLDPNKHYFLDNTPRDFSRPHINLLSPNIYISESRVTDQVALFRFKSTVSDRGATIGFSLPTPPIGSIPDTPHPTGAGQYTLKADLSKPVVIFFDPLEQVSLPYNLRDARFTAGLQFDGIFQLGGFAASGIEGSGKHGRTTINNINKESISAAPPGEGQTILRFALWLPQAPSTFSFSAGLREGCSQGVMFEVRLNGQTYFEHLKDTFDWTDGSISLSQFAGQPMLLELVTDPAEESGAICDWAFWADLHITAAPNPDANLDGRINVLDLILVASSFGEQPPSNPLADTNKDGVVNLLDLVFVADHLSQNVAAPSQLALIESIPSSAKEVIAAQRALTELEAIPNKSHGVRLAIQLLRHYLSIADQNVKETKLMLNYPNPFNPDTWIPYQLSEGSTVTVKIYDVTGSLVRTIQVGHKPVGYYLTRERAVYWDGRNEEGESVSSGIYFYTLNTDTYTQTRRMAIVK